ncbi:MAG: hypothetical protein JNL82_16185 [Myxococcales bacterium]|nr:hypothetical protein [Myxococcales bacterium]
MFVRCEGRELASDPDWCHVDDGGSCRDIPEGTLLVRQTGEKWELYWCREKEVLRRLARGSRVEVEKETCEVVLFGLPGGPWNASGTAGWWFDEGSLHRATTEGVFRLMLQPGGRGCLVFVRHDATVLFLGQDQRDALIHTAERRLAEHRGSSLHVWFMGQRLPLRGLGVLGVVGQVELANDVRIALVRIEQDLYELHVAARRDDYNLIGVYTSADLLRGDLGGVLVSGPSSRPAAPAPARAHETPPPPEPPPPANEPPPSSTSNAARRAPPPVTEEDRRRLDTCLTLGVFVGEGSSVIKYIYDGFRILVTEGREDELFRTKVLRKLIEQKLKQVIPGSGRDGGHRTFVRALLRFLDLTGLGRLEGRRVRIFFGGLRRGDSAVVATLRERFAPAAATPETAAQPPVPSTTTASPAAPFMAAPPMPPTAAPPASPATTMHAPPTTAPPMATPPAAGQSLSVDALQPAPPAVVKVPAPPAGRWQSALRRDGPTFWKPTYAKPSSPDDPSQFAGVEPESTPNDPSQFAGVEPRGPPKNSKS